ncbi:MAG: aldo/keto reductase [Prevotella sp.]|nr:aldo/keto reductase [Prevotella sp.]
MEYQYLKNSDLKVSRLCIGGDPMGGHAWGDTDDKELIDAVNTAVDNGINFFDTADIYGIGHAETLLGKALGTSKNDVIIASKFGVRKDEVKGVCYYDNRPEWIEQAIVGSLKRLGRDYIDIYQLHWRDGKTPISEVVDKLRELKKKGYIRYFGLSNVTLVDLEELMPYKGEFVSFQDQYSLAWREGEEAIAKLAEDMNLTPMTWGSLGQGILSGKYGADTKFDANDRRSRSTYPNFHGEKLMKNLKIVEKMREIDQSYQKGLPAIAIRFILDYLKDSVVIVGVKRPQQVIGNCEAAGWNLSEQHINDLEAISK